MAKIEYKVCAVTVTYGNRWEFLSQILKRLLSFERITQIVIVNNASSYNVKDKINELADNRLILIDNDQNLGSTSGYKTGMAKAYSSGADFIWLLDDDNLPNENGLDALLNSWDELNTENNKTAFFCLRTDRSHHIEIAKGENPYRYYLIPDNFLNFTILRPYSKLSKLIAKFKFKESTKFLKRAEIPFASYGGFFFHKDMIDEIGYPDEKFFLYFDDAEFTYRVTTHGGRVWLIPDSIITDIDHSYQVNYKRSFLHSIHLDLWNFRTYYTIRNGVFFYKQTALKRPLLFKINKFLYLSWLYFVSIMSSKQNEYKKLVVAVEDGLNGKLGKADPEKF